MQVAVKYGWIDHDPVVDESGALSTGGGGQTIVHRLLDMYPGAVLLDRERREGAQVPVVTFADIDVDDTLVINLDVIDSVGVFQALHTPGNEPKIMNFQWTTPSIYHHQVNFAAMALSYALFPTFCSGNRTAGEVREVLSQWMVSSLGEKAKIAWADLGVFPDRLKEREATDVPRVLYPAIYLSERKQPLRFLEIVEAVRKRTPIQVDMHLAQSHLVTHLAMNFSRRPWINVGPLTAPRDDYWGTLSRTTAFLATSNEEAYGIQYLEALLAGAVGIFPDLPWARAILPETYPFFYGSDQQAVDMLTRAVTEPEAALADMASSAGMPISDWVRAHHSKADFEQHLHEQIAAWFPGA
ncbi:glycosyltransferase family 1 protein [Actinomycetota bacterium]